MEHNSKETIQLDISFSSFNLLITYYCSVSQKSQNDNLKKAKSIYIPICPYVSAMDLDFATATDKFGHDKRQTVISFILKVVVIIRLEAQ